MSCICTWASPIVITSPSAQTKVVVDVSNEAVNYSLYHHGNKLLEQKHLTLILDHETLGDHPRVASTSTTLKKYELHPVIALKQRVVSGSYRNTIIHFKNHYALEFRVMDDAVAYRFILQKKARPWMCCRNPSASRPISPSRQCCRRQRLSAATMKTLTPHSILLSGQRRRWRPRPCSCRLMTAAICRCS